MYRKNYRPNNVQKGCPSTELFPTSREEYRPKVEANYVDHEGSTHLHLAVRQGSEALLDTAIKAGCDVNAQDKYGCCAIHLAADGDHPGLIKKLLMHASVVNTFNHDGHSPLIIAARKGHIGAVRTLLHGGAKLNLSNVRGETALHYAAAGGQLLAVDTLLSHKAAINWQDAQLNTALILATKFGHPAVVSSLIKQAACLNKKDVQGRTALHYAVDSQGEEMLEALIAAGADLQVHDHNQDTAFVLSIKCNKPTALKRLIAARCERSVIDGLVGGTPLVLAALKGFEQCVRVLLEAGDAPDETGCFGMTPLMAAAFESHPDVVDVLLRHGADPDRVGRMGVAAIHKCLLHICPSNAEARHKILAKLIRANADLNLRLTAAGYFTACTNGRNCPLSFALSSGYVSMVSMLVMAGASVRSTEQWVVEGDPLTAPLQATLTQPLSLLHTARLVTRRAMGRHVEDKLADLPLAKPLKTYLNFEEFDYMAVERVARNREPGPALPDYLRLEPVTCWRALEGTLLHLTLNSAT